MHQNYFGLNGFNVNDCQILLEAACMSDEEDNDGDRKTIRRIRPCWRSQKVNMRKL
jgi:hypothetical protein